MPPPALPPFAVTTARGACLLLCALFANVAVTSEARAHRLIVDCHVLPGGKVQVESWFDISGDSPKGAKVRVLRTDGQVFTEGVLDDQGIFVFTAVKTEPLKVVVSAGAGHRAEQAIRAESLTKVLSGEDASTFPPAPDAGSTPPLPLSDRASRVSFKDVVIGIAFILSLAAFVLSVRNARRLRHWKRGSEPPAP